MGDQFEHNVVNARKSGRRAVQETRQLPAVAPGQMPPGQLNLLFDQVEVVQQPFGGGGDDAAWIHSQGRSIEGPEHVLVLAQPGQQPVGTPPRDHLVAGGESLGMARQLFDAEQLGPQRRFARAWARTLMRRPPVLNAQWQSLHVLLTLGHHFFSTFGRGNSPPWRLPASLAVSGRAPRPSVPAQA